MVHNKSMLSKTPPPIFTFLQINQYMTWNIVYFWLHFANAWNDCIKCVKCFLIPDLFLKSGDSGDYDTVYKQSSNKNELVLFPLNKKNCLLLNSFSVVVAHFDGVEGGPTIHG